MFSEKTISMGSTNITRKAFGQLSELNLTMDNVKSQFTDMLMSDIYANLAASHEVSDADKIKYRLIMAFLEGFVV